MKPWEKNIRKVVPYVPGEQPEDQNIIKLNTNENPYPPSPKVEAMRAHVENLRKYPNTNAQPLVDILAKYHGISNEQVFVGVGSDDVLAMCFMTFFNGNQPIFFPDISYSFYDVWAEMMRIPYEVKPLDENFHIVKEDYYGTNGGVIFPNPNAPTAIGVSLDFIEDILKHNQESVVIIDEAYIDFGGETVLPLIQKYDNLLVTRTFSKSRSLAGLRVGYCMGNKDLIQALNDVKQSFNSYTMNQAAITLGVASVEDEDYFVEHVQKIIHTREWFSKEMRALGFEFGESQANFIFAKHKTLMAKDIFEAAKKEGIFFRYFSKERINNYLRITIGTDEEMKTVIEFLKNYIKNN